MRITVKQLRQLIREQVEEESRLETFNKAMGEVGDTDPLSWQIKILADVAIAAVAGGAPAGKVVNALKQATGGGGADFDRVLGQISIKDRRVAERLRAADGGSHDRQREPRLMDWERRS